MESFELQVTFTGLCLFLVQEDEKKVLVVQPDCRKGGMIRPPHPGGGPTPYHIGYLRFDLANLDSTFPIGTQRDGPAYEVVHRFAHEDLFWGLPLDTNRMGITAEVPEFEKIAPDRSTGKCLLEPIRGLTGDDAPLVMRTILSGGSLTGRGRTSFYFPKAFDPMMQDHTGNFADKVTWTRTVEAAGLNLCIRPFGSATGTRIPLKPMTVGSKRVITLKIANLCSRNPLEWNRFEDPGRAKEDIDFRWLYRILKPVSGKPFEDLLSGKPLPAPTPMTTPGPVGVENCIPGRITVPTT